MTIFMTGKNKYAIGKTGERAQYVVMKGKGGFRGVRGVRPMLEAGRFKKVTPSAALKAAFEEAIK